MAVFDTLLQQALQLPEKERGELVEHLLRSLEPHDGEPPDAWETAWSEEIDRRMSDVRDGTAELIDGDGVFRAAKARIASRRR